MKKILTGILGLLFFVALSAQGKKIVESSVIVKGACDMCKERIENAAYIKGVKFAEWDKQSEKLKLAYRSDKTTQETIEKSIAKLGHDTENFKADSTAYHNLPECCAYRSEHIHKH